MGYPVSREWVRVLVHGPSPVGRYGHTVTMVGKKFIVFGGQVNQEFLNDLWAFDLNSRKPSFSAQRQYLHTIFSVRSKATWELIEPAIGSERPAPRTNHACVTFDNKIIMYVVASHYVQSSELKWPSRRFGGTDGQYHYNDVWSFDIATRRWSELNCIGFIPSPREGHAASVVNDVMYVFGGRGIDGKDLEDLAAFKLSSGVFQSLCLCYTDRWTQTRCGICSKIWDPRQAGDQGMP
jgi:hypothetical protein